MDQIEKYIEELMEKSTPDRPIWNIEKIMQGLKSTWNYIDQSDSGNVCDHERG